MWCLRRRAPARNSAHVSDVPSSSQDDEYNCAQCQASDACDSAPFNSLPEDCSHCNTYSACAPCFAEHFEPDYHHTQAKQGFVDWNPPRDLFREECCRSFGISFDGMPGVIWERPTTTTCSPKDGSAAGCIYTQSWPALDSSPRMYMKDGKWVVGEEGCRLRGRVLLLWRSE